MQGGGLTFDRDSRIEQQSEEGADRNVRISLSAPFAICLHVSSMPSWMPKCSKAPRPGMGRIAVHPRTVDGDE
jgi:hypothetical protein